MRAANNAAIITTAATPDSHPDCRAPLSQIAALYRPEIEELLPKRPGLARAFWWCTLVDEAILREWLVDLGSRSAEHRIAHLFCELYARLETVSLVQDGSFELPLTQTELADTAGMSTVHVNRSLKELRTAGLVTFRGGRVVIPDVMRLMDYSAFDPAYLHRPEGKARGMLPEQGMAPLV